MLLIFVIRSGNKTGLRNATKALESQDAVLGAFSSKKCCIVLADGAGSYRYSGDGARYAVRYICTYLMKKKNLLYRGGLAKLRYRLCRGLYRHLRRYADKARKPLFLYGSTLLFVLTDGKAYITGHLGDGVIACQKGKEYNISSFPTGRLNRTYLTTDLFSYKNMRIRYGRCDTITAFLLMSDGLCPAVFDRYYHLNRRGSLISAAEYYIQLPADDDASYIFCEWR